MDQSAKAGRGFLHRGQPLCAATGVFVRRFAAAMLWLFLVLPVYAQEGGTVSGVVVSSWDGSPLSGVVVSVRGTTLAVTSPRVIEIATSEKVGFEELGGVDVHDRITGQIDRIAENEDEAIQLVKPC